MDKDSKILCAIVRAVIEWINILDNRISLGSATKEEIYAREILCKIVQSR